MASAAATLTVRTATLTVRTATPDDAALMDQLVRETARHEGSLDAAVAGPEQWRVLLGRDDVQVFVACDGETTLGYVSATRRLNLWLGTDVIALDDLWVRDGARDRGVGRELMLAVARLATEESLTVVWGAQLDNEGAHRFYRRLGARLHTKVVASWTPEQYLPQLRD